MLFNSSDEEVEAILEQYKEYSEEFEKYLLSLHIRSDGHLSLNDVYNMPLKLRNLYVKTNNEFVDEQNQKNNQ